MSMSITQAEEVLELLKPNVSYLTATVMDDHEYFEENMKQYIELAEEVSEAKIKSDIQGFEDIIKVCEETKEFYSIDALCLLYKYDISDESITKCIEKTKVANELIDEVNNAIQKLKDEIQVK